MPTRTRINAETLKKIDRFPDATESRSRLYIWPDLLEDLVQLLREDEVRRAADMDVPADRGDLRELAVPHQPVVGRDRAQERVDVGILGVREAQLRRGVEVRLPADERSLDPRLDPDVIVPVDAEDEDLHRPSLAVPGYIKLGQRFTCRPSQKRPRPSSIRPSSMGVVRAPTTAPWEFATMHAPTCAAP